MGAPGPAGGAAPAFFIDRFSISVRGDGFFGEAVVDLALPAGSYVIMAKLTASAPQEGACWVTVSAPGDFIDNVGTGGFGVLSLLGHATLTTPGTAQLRCAGRLIIETLRLTAIPVGGIVQP